MSDIIICKQCGYKTTPSSISAHIKNTHSDLSIIEQIKIHQRSILSDAKVKIHFLQFSFINFIIEKFNIKTLAEYGKLTYKMIPKWNSYAEMISQFREVESADIQVFFDVYLPYKKEHPKDANSRKLAEIACINYQEDTDKFYQEVLMKRNAYTGHGGELSPFSKDFKSYSHLSDDEKNKVIRQKCFCKDRKDFDKLKKNNTLHIEYYLNKRNDCRRS
jgi:hypothetical protein